jgi:hypothetical protein
MTKYHSRLVTGKKPEAISLGRRCKIVDDGADVKATRDLKRMRQKEVSHSCRGEGGKYTLYTYMVVREKVERKNL